MNHLTKAFNEALEYLKEHRGVSNNSAYKQIGWTEAQGKQAKVGNKKISEGDLCKLAETYSELITIYSKYGISCSDKISEQEFRAATKKTIKEIKERLRDLEKLLD